MRALITVSVFAVLLAAACRRDVTRSNEVVAIAAPSVPFDPGDRVWQDAPEYAAQLLPQDLVDPRLMTASTAEVLVRAAISGSQIAFRLQWADLSKDDMPGVGHLDACAIQFPAGSEPELPDPQMGAQGKPVEIAYWRADWQAAVNGREDSIQSIFPNAAIDHYPFDAPPLGPGSPEQQEFARRYAPADAAGNRRVGPRENPVEDLLAEGPGTLEPAGETVSKASGVFGERGWSVVIVRTLPAGLMPPERAYVALAVWQGSQNEVGSRKMRSAWIPITAREAK